MMNDKAVLHLVFDDKFIDRAIAQFEKAMPDQHHYLLDTPSPDHSIKYIKKNIDKVDIALRGSKEYLEKIKASKAKVVVLHSLSYYYAHLVNTTIKDKKIIWIFWGGEVYDYLKEFRKDNFKSKTKAIAKRFLWRNNTRNLLRPSFFKLKNPGTSWNFSKYEAFQKIDGFALAHANEFELLKQKINLPCQLHWFTYYSIEHLISSAFKDATVRGQNILIGNSATPSNNHVEILEQIQNEISIGDRTLIVPLSYGEEWYKKRIQSEGQQRFPNNFKALTDFMPLEEYNQIVFSCNVVIMNHLRQQAVGNLILSFWIGAMVYLDEQNPLFGYFKSLGLIVFSIQSDLKLIEENSTLNKEQVEQQRAILIQHYQEANVIQQTRNMLEHYLNPEQV